MSRHRAGLRARKLSDCKPGYLCVTYKYSDKINCVYPCTSDSECQCGDGYTHRCSVVPTEYTTSPGKICHLQF